MLTKKIYYHFTKDLYDQSQPESYRSVHVKFEAHGTTLCGLQGKLEFRYFHDKARKTSPATCDDCKLLAMQEWAEGHQLIACVFKPGDYEDSVFFLITEVPE